MKLKIGDIVRVKEGSETLHTPRFEKSLGRLGKIVDFDYGYEDIIIYYVKNEFGVTYWTDEELELIDRGDMDE